jgi:topoisomerase-4 subunit A
MHGRNKGGKAFLTLEAGDKPAAAGGWWPGHRQVACLALDGRLLVFGSDELKLQSNGGKGPDADGRGREGAAGQSVATLADSLRVLGQGRGGKPKDERSRAQRWPNTAASARARGKMLADGSGAAGRITIVR